jgi:ribosome biogenesis GTPase
MHLEEPKCAIKAAVENEEISPSRYMTYVQLMSEDTGDNYRRNDFK